MNTEREHWGSRLGFILTAAGSAIGLGTLWKLPYVMGQNGGGAFILLFIIFNFLIGIPLFIAELLIGKQSQRGVVGSFISLSKPNSSWSIIGWLHVATSLLILGWYCVVGGWGFNYILMSLADSFHGQSAEQVGAMFDVFHDSGDLNVFWQLMFLGTTAGICLKGVSSIEYWNKIMTSGLFIMLVLLAGYSFTLEGRNAAFEYLLYPDFAALNTASILKALVLSLFTLSLGYGIMITYGSYLKKTDDIPKTALIVGTANLGVSILIAMMIFPIVFTFGFAPQEGEGLVFKALPYAFGQLPGSIVVSTLFFALLLFAAISSSVSMLEVSVANLMDINNWSRKKAILVSSIVGFVIGLPTALAGSNFIFPSWPEIFGSSFIDTNNTIIDWLMAIGSLFTALFVGFFMEKSVVKEGYCSGSGLDRFYGVWLFLVRWAIPIAILIIILQRARIIDAGVLDRLSDFLS